MDQLFDLINASDDAGLKTYLSSLSPEAAKKEVNKTSLTYGAPLFTACLQKTDNDLLVKHLIDFGADPSASQDEEKMQNPLVAAIEKQNILCMRALLAGGAKVEKNTWISLVEQRIFFSHSIVATKENFTQIEVTDLKALQNAGMKCALGNAKEKEKKLIRILSGDVWKYKFFTDDAMIMFLQIVAKENDLSETVLAKKIKEKNALSPSAYFDKKFSTVYQKTKAAEEKELMVQNIELPNQGPALRRKL